MKETQPTLKDNVKIINQVKVKKTREHVGALVPHDGHTLFEFNKITKELRKATFASIDVSYADAVRGLKGSTKSVIVKENCFYVSSLNE